MMQTVLSSLKEISRNSGIVVEDGTLLEYRLPMEGGRRPDLIVLENGVVVVLEFKGKPNWKQSRCRSGTRLQERFRKLSLRLPGRSTPCSCNTCSDKK